MVQVGAGTLLGVGMTVLIALLGVVYKVSVNILSVSKSISNLNDSIGAKLDELNRNVDAIGDEIRRISETTTRIETKLESATVSHQNTRNETTGEVETTSEYENQREENDDSMDGVDLKDAIDGEYTLSETGVRIRLERRFLPTTTGAGRHTVNIEFLSDTLLDSGQLVNDIAALVRGFGFSPEIQEETSNGNPVVRVALYTFDGNVIDEWTKAALRLLDNDIYYKSIDVEGVDDGEYIDADFEDVEEADANQEEQNENNG